MDVRVSVIEYGKFQIEKFMIGYLVLGVLRE